MNGGNLGRCFVLQRGIHISNRNSSMSYGDHHKQLRIITFLVQNCLTKVRTYLSHA